MSGPSLSSGEGSHLSERDTLRLPSQENALSASSAPGALTPPPDGARFLRQELVGQGGQARVYRGMDLHLKRSVAIKLLRSRDPSLLARFFAEARSQARIDHDNVCRVYEVGELDGEPFIAMQLVAGPTLQQAAAGMSLDEKVRVMLDVAEAVHHAHQRGLVHRDLKPSNILLERAPEGGYKPYVTDFGLARDVEGPGLTRTGDAIGTPSYMSPEQALGLGGRVDRRTDVWGLGATLYEVLAGKPPFTGAGYLEIIEKVVREEVPSVRASTPGIPSDLDTIVRKCLAKEAARRYASARALADDLRRFLSGESISARPASTAYRLSRWYRKNRALAAIAAAAGTAVLALGLLWGRDRMAAAERARHAQRLGQEVERLQAVLDRARLLPLHDVARERGVVESWASSVEARLAGMGRAERGAARYALGRAYLALGRPGRARTSLEGALADGLRTPATSLALGRALGELYQSALEEAEGIRRADLRKKRQVEATRELRMPALEHLRLASGTLTESPELVAGLIAFYDGREEAALGHAASARERSPWLYEADGLTGDVFLRMGRRKVEIGDFAGARRDYAAAGEALERAVVAARSDARAHIRLATLFTRELELALLTGDSPEGRCEKALDALSRALIAEPLTVDAHTLSSRVHFRLGEYLEERGGDPSAAYERAIVCGRDAARLGTSAQAWNDLGLALETRGAWKRRRGVDPRADLLESIASFREAVDLKPRFAQALSNLGIAHRQLGEWDLRKGHDPRASFRDAEASYDRALRIEPDLVFTHQNKGIVLTRLADYERQLGLDPRPTLERAVAAYGRSLALNPKYHLALQGLAAAHGSLAEYEADFGIDPSASFQRSFEASEKAIALNPSQATTRANHAVRLVSAAAHASRAGRDPQTLFEKALVAADAALDVNPKLDEAWYAKVVAHASRARHGMRQGFDPNADLKAAEDDLARMLKATPEPGLRTMASAAVALARGEQALRRGRFDERAALAALRQLAPTESRDRELHLLAAELWCQIAEARLARRTSVDEAIARGLEHVAQVTKEDAGEADARFWEGRLSLVASRARGDSESARRAVAAFQSALSRNRLLAPAIEPLVAEARTVDQGPIHPSSSIH